MAEAGCAIEISGLPVLLGCPGNNELILVTGATGGVGQGQYALRKWSDMVKCISGTILPYVGVVDRGNPNDPVSGTNIFKSTLIAGLGVSNNGDIQIVIDKVLLQNFGAYPDFTYNPAYVDSGITYGQITLINSQFYPQSTLFIDRNQ